MIIELKRAILHRCETEQGYVANSNELLDITDGSINAYILSHVEKSINSPSIKRGTFLSNSGIAGAIQSYDSADDNSFLELSMKITSHIYDAMCGMEKPHNAGVLVCELEDSSKKEPYIAILKLDSKAGYLLSTIWDEDTKNTFTPTPTIMPLSNQTLSDYAFINLSDMSIMYASKKYMVEGERVDFMAECVLGCQRETASSKEINAAVKSLIQKMSADPVDSTVKLKGLITDRVAKLKGSEELTYTLDEVAEEIFNTPSQKSDFINAAKQKYEVISEADEALPVDDYTIKKTNEKVKVATDTGVEIKFPHSIYNDVSKFDISFEDDGTYTISIKGVQDYELK